MKTVCFDCTKYDPDDQAAVLLAYLSSAPYLALFYQLVIVYSRRELHGVTTLLGLLTNAALSKALKRLIRQSRPLQRCHLLGNCANFGMPSSHAQLMFFVWALHALFAFRRPSSGPQRMLHLAESLLLALASFGVGYGRIYLGYHDISQVAFGALVGAAFAVFWYGLTVWLAERHFKDVLVWRVSRLLYMKDTFPLGPDVLAWERSNSMDSKSA